MTFMYSVLETAASLVNILGGKDNKFQVVNILGSKGDKSQGVKRLKPYITSKGKQLIGLL